MLAYLGYSGQEYCSGMYIIANWIVINMQHYNDTGHLENDLPNSFFIYIYIFKTLKYEFVYD